MHTDYETDPPSNPTEHDLEFLEHRPINRHYICDECGTKTTEVWIPCDKELCEECYKRCTHTCENCGFVDTIELATLDFQRLCQSCFGNVLDEYAHQDKEFERRADQALDSAFAIQESLAGHPAPKPDSRKESRKDARRKHYRRAVLGRHISAYYFGHYHFVGYKNGHVPPWNSKSLLREFSWGHGHRNFGRKPRHHKRFRRNHDVDSRRFLHQYSNFTYEPFREELDEKEEALDYYERWLDEEEEALDYNDGRFHDYEEPIPYTASEYWPEVYTFTFAARFDLGDRFDDPCAPLFA